MTTSPPAVRRGAQTPRVANFPEAVSSAAPEFIDLAASAGLVLDPWQQYVLTHGLGETSAGRWASFKVSCWVPRQNGKGGVIEALTLGWLFLTREPLILHSAHEYKDLDVMTPVLTANRGWTTMGELASGDEVYAPDGQPTKVVAAHPVLTDSTCYEVRLDDGQTFVAGAHHLWSVTDKRTYRCRVMTTQEMVDAGVSRRQANGRARHNFAISLPEPLDAPEVDLPVDPWLFGYWLGDGATDAARLTVGREDLEYVTARIAVIGEPYRVLYPKDRAATVSLTDGVRTKWDPAKLRARLSSLGVLGGKHIPDVYARASRAQRAELLAGILDSDGCAMPSGEVVVNLVDERLAEDVLSLVRGLGYKATMFGWTAVSQNGTEVPAFRVRFRAYRQTSPFGMSRKAARLPDAPRRPSRSSFNSIVSIARVVTRPTRCITVAHESACYLVGRGFTVTHNTAQEAFLRLKGLVQQTPDLDRRVARYWQAAGEQGIELTPAAGGARLRFIARSKGSGRGFTGYKHVLDEAQEITSPQMAALLPTLAAVPDPQVWFFGTPPDDPGAWVYGLRSDGQAGVPRMAHFDWGADLDPTDPGDIRRAGADRDLWYATNPALGIRIAEDFVADEAQASGLGERFAVERLGAWLPRLVDGSGVIDLGRWGELADPASRREGAVAFAVDVTPLRDWASIAVYGLREDGLGHAELIDHRQGTDWLVERLVQLRERHQPVAIGLDVKGPAGSLLVDLEKAGVVRPGDAGQPEYGQLAIPTAQEVAAGCGQLVDAVVQGTVRHIGQEVLETAIRGAKTRPLGDAWAWGRRVSTVDISPLVAVTLARWAYESRAHLITDSEYDVLDSVL